jgi:hypothetical protein
MKKYLKFVLEQITENQNKYLLKIINYIKKNSDVDLFEYDEIFIVDKIGVNKNLSGILYLIPENKAVRFNFDESQLFSIDIWDFFEFNIETIINKPSYTYETGGSIVGIMDNIVSFIEGDFDINESETIMDEPKISTAPNEKVKLSSIDKAVLDGNIDVFESVKLYTAQVAFKVSNSLVISGAPGLGKTYDVEKTLKDMRIEFIPVSGDITTSGLYEILFKNRKKLILFDDMDSVYKSEESVNLLKAVLDTKPKRKVSRILTTYFDSFDMTDEEIEKTYNDTGKLPKQFEFTGRIIFITNKSGDKLDTAFISRSLFVDVNPDFDDVLARIKKIMPNIRPNISIEKKNEIINFMVLLTKTYDIRFAINLRSFIHCLNMAVSNDFDMDINGENVPVYKMLIKQFLVKK